VNAKRGPRAKLGGGATDGSCDIRPGGGRTGLETFDGRQRSIVAMIGVGKLLFFLDFSYSAIVAAGGAGVGVALTALNQGKAGK